MNMKVRTKAAEAENSKLAGKLIIWQNVAVVSIVGNVILAIMLAITIWNKL